MDEKPWDFFMFVEMGVDRIHHGLWAHHDVTHRKHDPNSPFVNAIAITTFIWTRRSARCWNDCRKARMSSPCPIMA